MQIGTLARGKPIYRMSSFAPTRGPVNPQGYLQRELRKQGLMGSDGQSDRRSGLASGMLKNRGIVAGEPAPGGGGKPPGTPGFPGNGPERDGRKDGPRPPLEDQNTPGGPYGGIMNNAHTSPVVNVNEDGTLSLPFDLQSSKDAIALQQDFNAQLLGLQQDQQGSDLQYQMALRSAMQGYDQTKRDTLNSAAAGGNAFGSAYGYAAGRNANEFANTSGNLTAEHGLGQANTAATREALVRDFNQQLALIIADQAAAAAEDAGSLGYGHAGGGKGDKGGGKGNGGGKGGKKKKKPIKMKGIPVPPPKNPGPIDRTPGLPHGPR